MWSKIYFEFISCLYSIQVLQLYLEISIHYLVFLFEYFTSNYKNFIHFLKDNQDGE